MLKDHCAEYANDAIIYIRSIVNIPLEAFVEYIESIKPQPIYSADVFQFSAFENATTNLCSKINCCENAGLNFLEIGKLLLNDGVMRKDMAFRKYGENHIKMAEVLGLAFKYERTYYLSPIGCVYEKLSEAEKDKLIIRLILRSKLISQLFSSALKGAVDMKVFLYDLAESTYERRKSNIKYVIELLKESEEYNFSPITNNIKF